MWFFTSMTSTFGLNDEAFLRQAKEGQTEEVLNLLEWGANLECTDENGNTALLIAARFGHTDTVQRLIEKGANILACNHEGDGILHITVKNGHKETATLALKDYPAIGVHAQLLNHLLKEALKIEQWELMELLIIHCQDKLFYIEFMELLKIVVESGNIMGVNFLMNFSPLENKEQGDMLFNMAVKQGNFVMMRALAQRGLDINNYHEQCNPLLFIAEKGDVATLGALIDLGVNLSFTDALGNNALHAAASGASLEALKILMNTRVLDPRDKNANGKTPKEIVISRMQGLKSEMREQQRESSNTVREHQLQHVQRKITILNNTNPEYSLEQKMKDICADEQIMLATIESLELAIREIENRFLDTITYWRELKALLANAELRFQPFSNVAASVVPPLPLHHPRAFHQQYIPIYQNVVGEREPTEEEQVLPTRKRAREEDNQCGNEHKRFRH